MGKVRVDTLMEGKKSRSSQLRGRRATCRHGRHDCGASEGGRDELVPCVERTNDLVSRGWHEVGQEAAIRRDKARPGWLRFAERLQLERWYTVWLSN